jgi:hypothetical protein
LYAAGNGDESCAALRKYAQARGLVPYLEAHLVLTVKGKLDAPLKLQSKT